MTIHDFQGCQVDAAFKTINGRYIYEGIDYPNNASGWWCYISRQYFRDGRIRIKQRRIHTDTLIEIVEVYTD